MKDNLHQKISQVFIDNYLTDEDFNYILTLALRTDTEIRPDILRDLFSLLDEKYGDSITILYADHFGYVPENPYISIIESYIANFPPMHDAETDDFHGTPATEVYYESPEIQEYLDNVPEFDPVSYLRNQQDITAFNLVHTLKSEVLPMALAYFLKFLPQFFDDENIFESLFQANNLTHFKKYKFAQFVIPILSQYPDTSQYPDALLKIFAKIGDPAAIPLFIELLDSDDPADREVGYVGLSRFADREYIYPHLLKSIKSEDSDANHLFPLITALAEMITHFPQYQEEALQVLFPFLNSYQYRDTRKFYQHLLEEFD